MKIKKIIEINKRIQLGEDIDLKKILGNKKRGVKDPRIAEPDLLPKYKEIENTRFIVVMRNENDTIRSLEKTYSPEEAKKLYNRRLASLREYFEGLSSRKNYKPHIIIKVDDLEEKDILRKLKIFINI